MIGLISVTNGDVLAAVRSFLKSMLETRLVEALYVPMQVPGGSVAPALVTDPARLDQANPLAPVMGINGARAVSAITGKKSPARIGVVLRSCEIRALYELVKLQQASLDDVTVISLDCPGTFELGDVAHHRDTIQLKLGEYLSAAQEGRAPSFDGLELRQACQMCDKPLPDHADIALHLFGVDVSMGIPVVMGDELAEKLAVSPAPEALEAGRQPVVERLVAGRLAARKKELAEVRSQLEFGWRHGGLVCRLHPLPQLHDRLPDLLLQNLPVQDRSLRPRARTLPAGCPSERRHAHDGRNAALSHDCASTI